MFALQVAARSAGPSRAEAQPGLLWLIVFATIDQRHRLHERQVQQFAASEVTFVSPTSNFPQPVAPFRVGAYLPPS